MAACKKPRITGNTPYRWRRESCGPNVNPAKAAWGAKPLCVDPASQWERGCNESLNGKLGVELLNVEIFVTLQEAKVLIENWRWEHGLLRPHSSLG